MKFGYPSLPIRMLAELSLRLNVYLWTLVALALELAESCDIVAEDNDGLFADPFEVEEEVLNLINLESLVEHNFEILDNSACNSSR